MLFIIIVDKLKDNLKFLSDYKETFDIMFKEFNNLISKLQQPPPIQVSLDLVEVDDNQYEHVVDYSIENNSGTNSTIEESEEEFAELVVIKDV